MTNDRTHSALGDDCHVSLQKLVDAYGDNWVIRCNTRALATRRRQLPLDVLLKTELAMTIDANDLTDLAVQLEEQTRLAAEHPGDA